MSGFTGLTKLFGESSTRATICLANREAAHKGILPQYIYILFPKEMQFNEQKYCAEEAEDLKQRAGATNTCSAWISGSTNQNNCISLMENIIFERKIVRPRLTSTWFSTPSTAWSAAVFITPLRRKGQADIYSVCGETAAQRKDAGCGCHGDTPIFGPCILEKD